MKRAFVFFMLGNCLLAGIPAMAQEQNEEDVTEYFMDPDSVEGTNYRPDDGIVTSRRPGKTRSLIKVRANFIPQMLTSVEKI